MATTERLYRLVVDANQATRELQKLNTSVSGIDQKFGALGSSLKAFGTAIAAGLSFNALVSGVRAATNAMDDMGKASQKVGVSVEALQDIKSIADLSGVSFEALQTSIGKMSQAMSGFEGVGKRAGEALKALGVNVSGNTTEALAQIADQFKKMPDGAQKTAIAMELFGKAGKDMIPFLNQGGDAIRETSSELDRLGGKFSSVAAEHAERFNDAMTKIGTISRGVVQQFTTGLLPALTALAESFVDNYQKGTLFESIGRGIGKMLIFISKYVIVAVEYFKAFGNALGDVIAATIEAARGNFQLAGQILSMGDKVSDVEARIASRIKAIDDSFGSMSTQTEAATRGVKGFTVALGGSSGTSDAAKKAAAETERFSNELNGVLHDIEALEYQLKTGSGWSEYQAFVEKTKSGMRQLYSPEREAQLAQYIKTLSDLKAMVIAVQAAQAQADADDAKVAENRRRYAEAEGERIRAYEAMVLAIKKAIDPTIELSEAYDNLELAFQKGDITLAQYNRRYAQLEEISKKALGAITPEIEKVTSVTSILNDNFNSFFNNMQNGVAGAKEAFERMAQSILVQLARLAASKMFDKFFGKDTSWGLSNPFTSGMTPKSLATDVASRNLSIRSIPSTSVMKAGTEPQQFVSGSAAPQVTVINNAGAEIGVESRQNADGTASIDILVERKVKGMIASGAMDRVMASTFGARRRGFA